MALTYDKVFVGGKTGSTGGNNQRGVDDKRDANSASQAMSSVIHSSGLSKQTDLSSCFKLKNPESGSGKVLLKVTFISSDQTPAPVSLPVAGGNRILTCPPARWLLPELISLQRRAEVGGP